MWTRPSESTARTFTSAPRKALPRTIVSSVIRIGPKPSTSIDASESAVIAPLNSMSDPLPSDSWSFASTSRATVTPPSTRASTLILTPTTRSPSTLVREITRTGRVSTRIVVVVAVVVAMLLIVPSILSYNSFQECTEGAVIHSIIASLWLCNSEPTVANVKL